MILTSASLYVGVVFAAGFVLGTLRTLWISPALGEFRAVLVELPVMLWIAWAASGRILRRYPVPPRLAPRLAMGGLAFALLIAAEAALAAFAFARPPAAFLAGMTTPAGAAGLAGQIAFGLIPALRLAGRHA